MLALTVKVWTDAGTHYLFIVQNLLKVGRREGQAGLEHWRWAQPGCRLQGPRDSVVSKGVLDLNQHFWKLCCV
jgi:hypothetical protein